MAVAKSTGYCVDSLDSDIALFTTMHLRVFSGTPPASADAAETGTLLCVITEAAYAALTWAAATTSGGTAVALKSANTWEGESGDADANTGSSATTKITTGTGVATYCRLCNKADTGGVSTTNPRFQGLVGVAGAEFELSSTTITFGATVGCTYAALTKTPN